MSRGLSMALTLAVLCSGCDLPTDAEEARSRMAAESDRETVPLRLPMPTVTLNLKEEIGDPANDLSEVLDTTDFTLRAEADPFQVGFGDAFEIEIADLEPVTESFDLSVDPFTASFDVVADPVPVNLPSRSETAPLPPTPQSGELTYGFDYSDTYSSVTFGGDSRAEFRFITDETASADQVTVRLTDTSGNTLASGTDAVTLATSDTASIFLPLSGVTLPSNFDAKVAFENGSGDTSADNLTLEMSFPTAEVTSATGVDADKVQSVGVRNIVPLDDTGQDFSRAVLKTGTLSVTSFDFGDLTFTPDADFESDLSGKVVDSTDPDSVLVSGTVGPPSGATTVDVVTAGSVTGRVSDLSVSSATLVDVDFAYTDTVEVVDADQGELAGITEVEVASGSVTLLIENRMPVGGPLTLLLEGATAPDGSTIGASTTIEAAPGDGTAVSTTVTIDLTGATLTPQTMRAVADGSFTGSDVTVTEDVANDAVSADPSASVSASSVVVDPEAPNLSLDVEEVKEFTAAELGIQDVTDFLSDMDLNDVTLVTEITNSNQIGLALDSVTAELVHLPDTTAISDSDGNPIRILLADDTTGQVTVEAGSTRTISVSATTLVNELINRLADDQRVGIVARGGAGLSGSGSISATDSVSFSVRVEAPLDISIGPEGASFDRVSHSFVDLDEDAADLVDNVGRSLESGTLNLEVRNGVPLGVTVSIALAPTPTDTAGFDPFTASKRVVLEGLSFPAAETDDAGNATSPGTGTASASIPTADLDVFLERTLSLGVMLKVEPPPGGRARLTGDETVELDPWLDLTVSVTDSGGEG